MRFGVFGTGPWARAVHAPALAGHPAAELVRVWGRDLAKAKALGAEFEVPGFAEVDELLERVDAVALALPPRAQLHRHPPHPLTFQGYCYHQIDQPEPAEFD